MPAMPPQPIRDFPPAPPSPPVPPKPGTPTQQPGAPTAQPINAATGLPGQPVNTRWYPNLQSSLHPEAKVHPEVERAIRVVLQQVYDLQDAVKAQNQQLLGGAIGEATVAANVVTVVTVRSGGYYLVTPVVSFAGGSPTTPATAHAVMTGNRVTGVVVDDGGAGYASTPTVVFTVQ